MHCDCGKYSWSSDDIAAIITSGNTEEAQRKLRRVMLRTKTWLNFHGPDLAMHKAELQLTTGCQNRLQVDVNIENDTIWTKMDPRQTFLYQIQYSANKAQKIVG